MSEPTGWKFFSAVLTGCTQWRSHMIATISKKDSIWQQFATITIFFCIFLLYSGLDFKSYISTFKPTEITFRHLLILISFWQNMDYMCLKIIALLRQFYADVGNESQFLRHQIWNLDFFLKRCKIIWPNIFRSSYELIMSLLMPIKT